MKSLLRTGWIRAGVPKCDIESLADHSWAVSIFTYFFCLEENSLRTNRKNLPSLNTEKAVLHALFHDFSESEYMDIDKSIYKLADTNEISKILQNIEEGAVTRIINQLDASIGAKFLNLLEDRDTAEFRIARVADHIDVMNQASIYRKKRWITLEHAESFRRHALNELEEYLTEFLFLQPYLERGGFLGEKKS
ncbi:MAG: HD domain-containing protein [Candidatus Hodarchaeales archaeon]